MKFVQDLHTSHYSLTYGFSFASGMRKIANSHDDKMPPYYDISIVLVRSNGEAVAMDMTESEQEKIKNAIENALCKEVKK